MLRAGLGASVFESSDLGAWGFSTTMFTPVSTRAFDVEDAAASVVGVFVSVMQRMLPMTQSALTAVLPFFTFRLLGGGRSGSRKTDHEKIARAEKPPNSAGSV
jgi:hypothetical protein